jgi:hypothetical protein
MSTGTKPGFTLPECSEQNLKPRQKLKGETGNLLTTTSVAFAGEEKAIDVDSFDYRGRSLMNAKAAVVPRMR